MARGLSDVLHHFDPALAREPAASSPALPDPASAVARIAVPAAPGDLLRTAIVWNLAVELRRAGGIPEVAFRADPQLGGDAATAGVGIGLAGDGPTALDTAVERATGRAASGDGTPLVLAALSPEDTAAPIDLLLLLVGPDAESRARAVEAARLRADAATPTPVGVTIRGARTVGEARASFEALARVLEAEGEAPVRSYGLLVDDLALYRSLVERRPVGFARPQSLATRALADVAGLLLGDLGTPG